MRVGRGGEKGIVCCNECLLNGQCDWRSNIFILGMIFLTQKKKKRKNEKWELCNQHVPKIGYLHFNFQCWYEFRMFS